MRLGIRALLILVFLAAAIAGAQALLGHLEPVGNPQPTPLRIPLSRLPYRLGEWIGEDEPMDEQSRYADEHLRRVYSNEALSRQVSVWAAYSGSGQDRIHHPEVCLAVAGQQEDRSAARSFQPTDDGGPIQQYRFVGTGTSQWVFYWHYMLPTTQAQQLDALQRVYQRMQNRPSSVTLEVFGPANNSEDETVIREFVALLDAAIRDHVGPDARRGSERLPVVVVQGLEPNGTNLPQTP